jgi:hypothetical protein
MIQEFGPVRAEEFELDRAKSTGPGRTQADGMWVCSYRDPLTRDHAAEKPNSADRVGPAEAAIEVGRPSTGHLNQQLPRAGSADKWLQFLEAFWERVFWLLDPHASCKSRVPRDDCSGRSVNVGLEVPGRRGSRGESVVKQSLHLAHPGRVPERLEDAARVIRLDPGFMFERGLI